MWLYSVKGPLSLLIKSTLLAKTLDATMLSVLSPNVQIGHFYSHFKWKQISDTLQHPHGFYTNLQSSNNYYYFEQLVGKQITAGFDSCMYEYSSAYQKAHSCEKTLITCNLHVMGELRLAIDNKLTCGEHSINRHDKGV